MILETSRLILRSFQREDIETLAELMANGDFMRFSRGPYTHEQTQSVLQKFLSWDQAGLPSQFAVISRKRDKLIGYRLHPDYWNRGLWERGRPSCPRSRVP